MWDKVTDCASINIDADTLICSNLWTVGGAQLVDLRESRVLGTQQFEIVETAITEDSYGGVVAANKAVSRLLNELALFCVSGAGTAHSCK